MNITVTKIKRELEKRHGWNNLNDKENEWLINPLIKDVLIVIDEQLRIHKNFSIKK